MVMYALSGCCMIFGYVFLINSAQLSLTLKLNSSYSSELHCPLSRVIVNGKIHFCQLSLIHTDLFIYLFFLINTFPFSKNYD